MLHEVTMNNVSILAAARCGVFAPSVCRFSSVLRTQSTVQHMGSTIEKRPIANGKIAGVSANRKGQLEGAG